MIEPWYTPPDFCCPIRNRQKAAILSLATLAQERRGRRRPNGEARMHRFSTTVEKERPQLNEETKRLIAFCRRDPTDANVTLRVVREDR